MKMGSMYDPEIISNSSGVVVLPGASAPELFPLLVKPKEYISFFSTVHVWYILYSAVSSHWMFTVHYGIYSGSAIQGVIVTTSNRPSVVHSKESSE